MPRADETICAPRSLTCVDSVRQPSEGLRSPPAGPADRVPRGGDRIPWTP
ncbi:hypothetical protein [Ornithinimicrobium kibberense]